MIRFACPHCGSCVRVADSFVGKNGRCPSCDKVVRIPAPAGRGHGPVAALAAALDRLGRGHARQDESEEDLPVPPPPAYLADEGEFEVHPPSDPCGQTDRMEALTGNEILPPASANWREPIPAPPTAMDRRNRVILIALIVICAAAVSLALVLLIYHPWKPAIKGSPGVSYPPPARPAAATSASRPFTSAITSSPACRPACAPQLPAGRPPRPDRPPATAPQPADPGVSLPMPASPSAAHADSNP